MTSRLFAHLHNRSYTKLLQQQQRALDLHVSNIKQTLTTAHHVHPLHTTPLSAVQPATLMPDPQPRRNKYFQTALKDPSTSNMPRTYKSATPSSVPLPPTETIKIIVGVDRSTSRTWVLPKKLLTRHSTYFSQLCTNPYKHEAHLEDVDPRDFANFVSYMHSSIYTLNEHVPGFRAIREGAKACLLGERLGCKDYSDAAIRQLYKIFEPLARLRTSNARKSSIRASDIEFVCQHTSQLSLSPAVSPAPEYSGGMTGTAPTSTTISASGTGLRQLFLDALASHWTQHDTLNIDAEMDNLSDTASWAVVYNNYPDFRVALAGSLTVADVWRTSLLHTVDAYLNPTPKAESPQMIGDSRRYSALGGPLGGFESGAVDGDGDEPGCQTLGPRSRIPSLKRKDSSGRRRRERAESQRAGGHSVRRWREGVAESARRPGQFTSVEDIGR